MIREASGDILLADTEAIVNPVNTAGVMGAATARRSYKFLLRPTSRQVDLLVATLNDHRDLYNAALQERRDAYRMRAVSISYGDQSAQLTEIRQTDAEGQGRWSYCSQQATLRRLNRAFDGFFRRLKAGQTPGFPRFKGTGWFNTVEWPKDRDGCRWDSVIGQHRVYLKGVGHVRVHLHREVLGTVKTISVKREGRKWFVIPSCSNVPTQSLPVTGSTTGIDLGIASFLTTSEGQHVPNPRHLERSAYRLAREQRSLARCRRGTSRRRKACVRVGAIYRKVRAQRLDFAHKTALDLIRRHDVICHETLQIRNMTKSARGTVEAPGSNVVQKAGLNRSILDAGWGVFLLILTAKAESAGRELIAVDPRNTSRTCSKCGHVAKENRVAQAAFKCVTCGHTAHADVNAAINILRAGLVLHAAKAA